MKKLLLYTLTTLTVSTVANAQSSYSYIQSFFPYHQHFELDGKQSPGQSGVLPARLIAAVTVEREYTDSIVYMYNNDTATNFAYDTAVAYRKFLANPYTPIARGVAIYRVGISQQILIQRWQNGSFENAYLNTWNPLGSIPSPSVARGNGSIYRWDGNTWVAQGIDSTIKIDNQTYQHTIWNENSGLIDSAIYTVTNPPNYKYVLKNRKANQPTQWYKSQTGDVKFDSLRHEIYRVMVDYNDTGATTSTNVITRTYDGDYLLNEYNIYSGLDTSRVSYTYTNGRLVQKKTERLSPTYQLNGDIRYSYDALGGIAIEDEGIRRQIYTNLTDSLYKTRVSENYYDGGWHEQDRIERWFNSRNQLRRQVRTLVNGAYGHEYRYYYENDKDPVVPLAHATEVAILLYPVPAKNTLNIAVSCKEEQPLKFSIRDIFGKPVKEWESAPVQNVSYTLDISGYSAGTYTFVVEYKGQNTQRRFSIAP